MYRKIIWIIVALIVIGGIFTIGYQLNKSTPCNSIFPDYLAKLQAGGPAMSCTYLYIDGDKYTYINTEEISHEAPPYGVDVKIVLRGTLKKPQDILGIAKKHNSLGAVILNKNINDISGEKEYKKGDVITPEELKVLIAKD